MDSNTKMIQTMLTAFDYSDAVDVDLLSVEKIESFINRLEKSKTRTNKTSHFDFLTELVNMLSDLKNAVILEDAQQNRAISGHFKALDSMLTLTIAIHETK